jgi:glycosyltransferase involved in cell wall biosynthesis
VRGFDEELVMAKNNLVSVIIPVYNCERYLAEAIESVLAQTYRPIEVIVVDDGSTDSSGDIARSYKELHYIYQPNQGVAVARNAGLAATDGEFIAFLDADDLWLPNKLRVQVDYLLEHPHIGYTIGRLQNFLDPGINLLPRVRKSLLERDQIGLMTLVVRKTVFTQIGGFDPSYRVGSDFEWFIRAKDADIPMAILPEILLYRRIHDSNLSSQTQACYGGLLRMFKASINRQRKERSGQTQ